jgi:hypothetical protein
MLSLLAFPVPDITRTDVWVVIILAAIITLAIKACRGVKVPDPSVIQSYATIANTQGGMILILLMLFISVFTMTTIFCIWTLVRGIDPQNGIVILLTGLFSGAIGAVSGALFTAMKGQEPKPPVTTQSTVVETLSTAVPPVPEPPTPPVPPTPAIAPTT